METFVLNKVDGTLFVEALEVIVILLITGQPVEMVGMGLVKCLVE